MRPIAIFARALLLTLPVAALAFANAAGRRVAWDLDDMGTSRRYWEDLTVAVSRFETRDWNETPALSIGEATAIHINQRLHEVVPRAAARSGLKPWEFWRTVEFRGFVNMMPFELRFSDDMGRASLSAIAFKWMGGVAPYLPIWLPFLAFVPMIFWILFEAIRARESLAGCVFVGLLSCSAYLLEALTLPYSAVGFHLLSGLLIVPLAFFAFGPRVTREGLWIRVVITALSLQVASWCRSSCSIFLAPAGLLLLVALFRAEAAMALRRRSALAVLLFLTLIAPRAFAPAQAHEVWVGVWEGLGDFDREHGHIWSDPAARTALDREGYTMAIRGPYWNTETEAIFRRLTLQDIQSYPFWYARILLQRVGAVVSQSRLAPTARENGTAFLPAQDPAEGFVETYYNFTATADVFTVIGRSWECSLASLRFPALLFLALVAIRRTQTMLRRGLVVLSFGIGAALMPVAITTASGLETQLFALTFLLSAAFNASTLVDLMSNGSPEVIRGASSGGHSAREHGAHPLGEFPGRDDVTPHAPM